jgi:hypothetical protein
MVDSDWIRNLAQAQYRDGCWVLDDPQKILDLKLGRMKDSLYEIRDEAQAAVALHNQFVSLERQMSFLETQPRPPHSQGGIMLMLGSVQASLELLIATEGHQVVSALVATLSMLRTDYTRSHQVFGRYQAQTDTFGSLIWRKENSLIMTPELIIKSLLEELTKTVFKITPGSPGPSTTHSPPRNPFRRL